MKKTLIALAAVAAIGTSGAAFAQATITGFMAAGYGSSTTGGATTSSAGGFGVDTAEIYITAKEDLGGGMTAGGTMGIGGLERAGGASTVPEYTTKTNADGSTTTTPNPKYTSASINGAYATYGTNYTMYVQSAAGKLTVGSVKSGDYVSSGLASSGVNYYDFGDAGNFGARSRRDIIALDLPVGPIALTLSHQEAANQVGEFNGAEGSSGQRINIISVSYTEGKLKANTQYFTYDNQKTGNTTAANVFRLSANYDLGMATVGGGLQRATYDSSATGTNYGLSASVPMGALTLGAMIGSRVTDGFAAAANGTQSSYSLNANYALSKRTGVTGQYSNWDNGVGSVNKSNMALLLLTHSF